MKTRILLIVMLGVVGMNISAQTNVYHAFPDSTYWSVGFNIMDPGPPLCHMAYTYNYINGGDTIINSIIYKKIISPYCMATGVDGMYCTGGCPYYYCGALRDDSIANQVFFRISGATVDSVLFDYNLNVGDTIKHAVRYSYGQLIITAKDSILIRSKYYKRWMYYGVLNTNGYFIQGIGSDQGLIEPFVNFEYGGWNLLCVTDSSGRLFPLGNDSSACELFTTTKEINHPKNTLTISPNPFTTQTMLIIQGSYHSPTLFIYNLMGQEVRRIPVGTNNQLTIQRNQLPTGMYFYQLIENNKEIIGVGKMLID